MITHIRTKGFKGFDIDEDVPQKVIYSGRNMSGKTTRAYAIALALYGNVPFSTAGKRPSDILDSFGEDSLIVAVTIGGKEFGRKFSRNGKGVVSQALQYEKKKCSADNFAIMLDKVGAPKIADVSTFMQQSEAKKIDTLFELFPNPELSQIDDEIETAKADVSRITKKHDAAESTVQRLTQSKNQIQLPPGSISECQAEISQINAQIADIEKQIKVAEIAEAEEKARAEGERKERERAENEKREAKKETAEYPIEVEPMKTDEEREKAGLDEPSKNPVMQEIDRTITKIESQVDGFKSGNIDLAVTHAACTLPRDPRILPDESIKRIINAMQSTGCTTCAALIVAKQELKKYA